MRLLLTSLGLSNPTIVGSLQRLLGKPLSESRMVYIPTALHAVPDGPRWGWEMFQLWLPGSWGQVGILELTALPGLPVDVWMPTVEDADAIVVAGGNTPFLLHWFERSGFGGELPRLLGHAVYVGASAGSMVVGTNVHVNRRRLERDGVFDDDLYGDVAPVGMGSARTLRLVDFAVRPHLRSPEFPHVTLQRVEATVVGPTWVLDDDSAVEVDGERVSCVSEGEWHLLP